MVKQGQSGALSPYRILDLTDSNGAYCAKLFADMGADVIKIERPGGCPGRWIPPFADDKPHLEKSLYFLYRNANKRGITLNIEARRGRDIFRELIKKADVLVENSSPGRMEGLGLDYSTLREINPELVMASMSDFGTSGPYKDRKGSNLVDFAMSGAMITSGFPDGVPCMVPGSPAYDSASQIAAISILVALFSRGSSGEGQHIDASAYEGSRVCIHPWPITFYSYADIDDRVVHTEDMRLASMSYPVYPCKDGFIRIMPSGPNQWDALVRVLGSPEVLLMPEWRDVYYRIGNADAIFSFVREYTENYTMVELFELGHREGIPIAPILDVAGFFHNAQTEAREFFVEVDHPVVGKAFYAGPPYKWSRTPPAIRRPAPCLGEHNEEIYCEELGFTRSELEVLKHDGVL